MWWDRTRAEGLIIEGVNGRFSIGLTASWEQSKMDLS